MLNNKKQLPKVEKRKAAQAYLGPRRAQGSLAFPAQLWASHLDRQMLISVDPRQARASWPPSSPPSSSEFSFPGIPRTKCPCLWLESPLLRPPKGSRPPGPSAGIPRQMRPPCDLSPFGLSVKDH